MNPWFKETGAPMPQTRLDQTTLRMTARGSGRSRRLRRGLILVAAAVAWAASAGGVAAAAPTASATHQEGAPRAGVPKGGPIRPASPLPGQPDFGPNVYVFTPSMPQSQIRATVDSIASRRSQR